MYILCDGVYERIRQWPVTDIVFEVTYSGWNFVQWLMSCNRDCCKVFESRTVGDVPYEWPTLYSKFFFVSFKWLTFMSILNRISCIELTYSYLHLLDYIFNFHYMSISIHFICQYIWSFLMTQPFSCTYILGHSKSLPITILYFPLFYILTDVTIVNSVNIVTLPVCDRCYQDYHC